jgi:hypothetical protein
MAGIRRDLPRQQAKDGERPKCESCVVKIALPFTSSPPTIASLASKNKRCMGIPQGVRQHRGTGRQLQGKSL